MDFTTLPSKQVRAVMQTKIVIGKISKLGAFQDELNEFLATINNKDRFIVRMDVSPCDVNTLMGCVSYLEALPNEMPEEGSNEQANLPTNVATQPAR